MNGPTALTAIRKPWTTAARTPRASESSPSTLSHTHIHRLGPAGSPVYHYLRSPDAALAWSMAWRMPKGCRPAPAAKRDSRPQGPIRTSALAASRPLSLCRPEMVPSTQYSLHGSCDAQRGHRSPDALMRHVAAMRPPQGKSIACALRADRLHAPSTGQTDCMRLSTGQTPIVHAMPCHVMHHAHRAARPRPRLSLKPFTGAHAASPAST